MSDNGVVWEDPGSPGKGGWGEQLQPLLEQPGRWARVREIPKVSQGGTVNNLKNRRVNYPPGRWEFTSRSKESKTYIYARYLGPEDGGS